MKDALQTPEERTTASNDALSKRTIKLETLGKVGVRLASSFDIQEILRQTHLAAIELLGVKTAEVYYAGHAGIRSKPRWEPVATDNDGLVPGERDMVERMLRQNGRSHVETVSELSRVVGRRLVSIEHRDKLLGVLFIPLDSATSKESESSLALLTLQAATALGNIHLTQQRIDEERLSVIGKMTGSVVHDFRGPLTAARGYAGMLSKSDLDDQERRTYGRYLIEECDRMNDMVEELLEFSRGGTANLPKTWVSVSEHLERLAHRVSERFGPSSASGAGLAVALEIDFDGELFVQERRLERALWNIAMNAAQAAPPGGRLLLRSHRRNDRICIDVTDDGPGIPESIRHRIFEPFFSFGKAEGIGLGMATAKKITEDHGGQLDIESKVGSGTTARLSLPVTHEGLPVVRSSNHRVGAGAGAGAGAAVEDAS
jgi:signal transduction histidine kinase